MKHVLVIEDELALADLIQNVLEDEGYRVSLAFNGEHGLRLLQQGRPDLILCDVMMPILNGLEFCKRVQANRRYSTIPIVLMSAVPQMLAEQFECRPAAYLAKPFDMDDLLMLVHDLIG